jgi:type IV secretory pathway TraG/TraD family ATPase VirD4
LIGASGSGKTTTIQTIVEVPIKNNYPVIYTDGKGSPSAWKAIQELCKIHNRNFKLFDTTNTENSFYYNPLSHGGFTELKDKIISLFNWTEEHYKLQADRFLQGLFKFIQLQEVKDFLKYENLDMKVLSRCLSINTILSLCDAVGEEKAKDMRLILADTSESSINGLMNRIQSIVESEIGHLFDSKNPNTIDLLESIKNNDVIFFSLNSLKFAEFAQMLGRLVIADIKTVASNFYDLDKKIYCVFDEFNVFASEIVVNLINKSREYGFRNIISTQEASDLIIDGQRKLLDQVWGNTNVKIAMRQEVPESQDMLAKSISTQGVYKVSINDSYDNDFLGQKEGKTGYTSTLEEEFIYKPKEFGQLKTGEAIVFVKHPEFRHSKIKIRRIEKDV